MTTETILNIVVILLLIPTIAYAVVLNRRLAALRRSREELAKIVNSFNDATMRAEAGIPKLKKATTEANHTLKDRVEKAQTLRDDLAFMIERAEELANRLETSVRAARAEGVTAHAAAAPAPNTYAPNTYAAAAPLSAARPSEPAAPPPRTLAHSAMAQTAGNAFDETPAELRSILGAARAEARLTEARSGAAASAAQPPPAAAASGFGRRRPAVEETPTSDERSEAERELLKALRSAR